MDRDVEVRPEHLGHRRLGTQLTALGDPRHRSEGVQPVGLRLDPRVSNVIGEAGVGAAGTPGRDEPLGRGQESRRAAQRHPALITRGTHRRPPAVVYGADHIVVGNEDVVEEDLPEPGVTAELLDRPNGHTVGMQVEHQIGQAAVSFGARVGAEQSEPALAEHRPAAPDLLTVEQPTAVGLSRRRSQRCQITAGLRLRPRLRPDLFSAGHFRQDPVQLLLGPVAEEGGGQHRDSIGAGPARGAGPEVLLFEHHPLQQARVAAAVLLRPGDHRQPGVEKHPVPAPVLIESLGGVIGLGGELARVLRQEGPDLVAERAGLVVVVDIHQAISRSVGLTIFPPALRGSASRKTTDRGVLKFARCCRV